LFTASGVTIWDAVCNAFDATNSSVVKAAQSTLHSLNDTACAFDSVRTQLSNMFAPAGSLTRQINNIGHAFNSLGVDDVMKNLNRIESVPLYGDVY